MHSWYRNDKLRIAAMALAAGLVVGGIVTYTAGLGTSKPRLASDTSVAAAIASDQAKPPASHANLTAKPPGWAKAKAKPKVKRVAAKRSRGKAKRAPAAAPDTGSPTATPTPASDVKSEEKTSAVKRVAAPRRKSVPRVVAKRRVTITPPKRTTPKSTPAPAPSKPAPAASTPAPAPAPTSAPAPSSTPRPNPGHGNGNGGDDDPGTGG